MKAHLLNCTYCIHRQVTPRTRKTNEIERCELTKQRIPSPGEGGRFCDKFHQEGHDCEDCYEVCK